MLPIEDTVPRRGFPAVTYVLIGINVFVFLVETTLSSEELERVFYLFGMVPARYSRPEWAAWMGFPIDDYWPFLTSMFLHGSWLHLFGNMWSLWIFGDNVEDRMGPWRFLFFYLFCGIAAGFVHWFTNASSTVPTVGASGAIAGVLGAYFFMFPYARIILIVPLLFIPYFFELPALTYLLFWFFANLFSGAVSLVGPGGVGGVAWWAHVGGFVAGAAVHGLFLPPKGYYRKHHLDELGPPGAWYVR